MTEEKGPQRIPSDTLPIDREELERELRKARESTPDPEATRMTVVREDDIFVATCLDTGITTHGSTPEEAVRNLQEALALFFE